MPTTLRPLGSSMNRLNRLIVEIHRRPLWLGVVNPYAGLSP